MVIGDDLDVIVLPDTDTTVRDEIITLENMISTEGNLRVGGAQIDTDCVGHRLRVQVYSGGA